LLRPPGAPPSQERKQDAKGSQPNQTLKQCVVHRRFSLSSATDLFHHREQVFENL
jgi:hypothetical protein